jgi:predicted nucleotidyltransferase
MEISDSIGHMPAFIGHMSGYNGHMTALGLLAKEVGVNERTLRRAVNEGVLRASRPSPRKLELPFSEDQYVRGHWTLIAKLREALRTEPNVRFAMLFGSAAKGDDTERSDIDVIVDLRDGILDRIFDLERRLEDATGKSVDVIRLEDAEDDPTFLANALEVGRVLVDRGGAWPELIDRLPGLRRKGRRRDAKRKRDALASIDRFLAARR